jgi:hypothetical protein
MIWPIVPLLRKYALPLGIVLVLALGWAWHRSAVNAARRQGYEQAQGEYAVQLAKANAAVAARDAQARSAFQTNETRWIGERSELENQISNLAGRIRPVRLCPPVAARRELPGAGAAAGSAGGAGEPGVDAVSSGPDIGPALLVLAGTCEQYRRRLIELKARWPE